MMKEKNATKINISKIFLILAIITIIVIGVFIYKFNNAKKESQQINDYEIAYNVKEKPKGKIIKSEENYYNTEYYIGYEYQIIKKDNMYYLYYEEGDYSSFSIEIADIKMDNNKVIITLKYNDTNMDVISHENFLIKFNSEPKNIEFKKKLGL